MAERVRAISEKEKSEESCMIEEYAIKLRTGRSYKTGMYEIARNGRMKEKTRYEEKYETIAGVFNEKTWKEKAMQEIERCEETELLEKVKRYCRMHCAWLHTEKEIEEYAINCLCSRVYRYLEDFEGTEEIVWM